MGMFQQLRAKRVSYAERKGKYQAQNGIVRRSCDGGRRRSGSPARVSFELVGIDTDDCRYATATLAGRPGLPRALSLQSLKAHPN